MKLAIFGVPGSGKGTQSKMIAEVFNLRHIALGDMLRTEVSKKTELGKEINSYISKGELIPDRIAEKIIELAIRNAYHDKMGYILDGYPRNVEQAKNLIGDYSIDAVIWLTIDNQVAANRIKGRGRADDTVEIIQHRINVYKEQTEPVYNYLMTEEKSLVHYEIINIDSDKAPVKVHEDIVQRLLKFKKVD